jgi:hypothetical protein
MFQVTYECIYLTTGQRWLCRTVFHSTVQFHGELERWNRSECWRYSPMRITPGYNVLDKSELFPAIEELGEVPAVSTAPLAANAFLVTTQAIAGDQAACGFLPYGNTQLAPARSQAAKQACDT